MDKLVPKSSRQSALLEAARGGAHRPAIARAGALDELPDDHQRCGRIAVMAILGHTELPMRMQFSHVAPEVLRQAVERINNALSARVGMADEGTGGYACQRIAVNPDDFAEIRG